FATMSRCPWKRCCRWMTPARRPCFFGAYLTAPGLFAQFGFDLVERLVLADAGEEGEALDDRDGYRRGDRRGRHDQDRVLRHARRLGRLALDGVEGQPARLHRLGHRGVDRRRGGDAGAAGKEYGLLSGHAELSFPSQPSKDLISSAVLALVRPLSVSGSWIASIICWSMSICLFLSSMASRNTTPTGTNSSGSSILAKSTGADSTPSA